MRLEQIGMVFAIVAISILGAFAIVYATLWPCIGIVAVALAQVALCRMIERRL